MSNNQTISGDHRSADTGAISADGTAAKAATQHIKLMKVGNRKERILVCVKRCIGIRSPMTGIFILNSQRVLKLWFRNR
jgi:hypothetical protein